MAAAEVYDYWNESPEPSLVSTLAMAERWVGRSAQAIHVPSALAFRSLWSEAVIPCYRLPFLVPADARSSSEALAEAVTVDDVLALLPADMADALRHLFSAFSGPCPEGFTAVSAEEAFDA